MESTLAFASGNYYHYCYYYYYYYCCYYYYYFLCIKNPDAGGWTCLLYTSPSPRDATLSRMPSSA